MIRLLGAITGSALAIATLLVLIGVPHFKSATSPAEVVEREVMTLPLPTAPVEADEGIAAAVAAEEPVVDTPADNTEPVPPEPAVAVAATADAAEPFPIEDIELPPDDELFALPPANEPQWYAFWSPFRSEIAASGFVSRLQSVTGLDYRIVKVKPGVYEVAFAYVDDTDITANLSQISAATGLDLPEN